MPHVLIVEDDPDVREMLDVLLQFHGYSTDTAANGREALTRAHQRRPCVVLLDLMMPIMSGWEFRAEQLQDPEIADVPVVCVTAVYDHLMVRERLHVPCLPKPVDFDDLLETVDTACAH